VAKPCLYSSAGCLDPFCRVCYPAPKPDERRRDSLYDYPLPSYSSFVASVPAGRVVYNPTSPIGDTVFAIPDGFGQYTPKRGVIKSVTNGQYTVLLPSGALEIWEAAKTYREEKEAKRAMVTKYLTEGRQIIDRGIAIALSIK
jgi:hypothetical protein